MVLCGNCGEEQSDEAIFCELCGAKIGRLEPIQELSPVKNTISPPSPLQDLKKRQMMIIGGGVVLIAIVALALYFFILPSTGFFTNPASLTGPAGNVLQDNTNTGGYWYNYGEAMLKEERYDEANTAFEKGLEIDPNNAKVLAYKGYALLKIGRTQEAITIMDKAIALDPNVAEAWSFKALALDERGMYQEAFKNSMKAIELNPSSKEGWVINGDILVHQNKRRDAVASYNKAAELDKYDNKINGKRKSVIGNMLDVSKKWALPGNDYRDLVTNNIDECEMTCIGDPKCNAFTFYDQSHPGGEHCYMKTAASTPVYDEDAISGIVKEK